MIDSIRISAESNRYYKQASFESGLRLVATLKSISTGETEPVQMPAIVQVFSEMDTGHEKATIQRRPHLPSFAPVHPG